jgi:hypothetical protein
LGLAGLGEELLNEAPLVVAQGRKLPPLRRDQPVQRTQTLGDLLLLGEGWEQDREFPKSLGGHALERRTGSRPFNIEASISIVSQFRKNVGECSVLKENAGTSEEE